MIELKKYQDKAVNELVASTIKLFGLSYDNKQIVLKSCTGSGKTVQMAKYIEAVSKNEDLDVCFLWISIGTGNLHEQSKNRITEILDGNPTCKLLEEIVPDGEIKRNQVIVMNWEKLNRKKKEEWDNVLMRNGEKTNFHDVIAKTLENRKIILIIDESHRSTDTKTSKELKNIIQPELIINISATPSYEPLQSAKNEIFIEVDIADVINEGVIKKEVLINDIVEDVILKSELEPKDILEMVLDMTIERRDSLKNAYTEEGKDINPLCLIQIPNSDKGDEILNELLPLLESRNISYEDKNLAIWTSKESTNLENLNDYKSDVDYLIFKLAVATGWDCPRAQVLLKLREVKSEVFDIQTIGRILRMPERIHYDNELLNKAYIYTNESEIKVNVENLAMVKWIKSTFREDIDNVELSSYFKKDNQNMLINRPVLDAIFTHAFHQSFSLSPLNTPELNLSLLASNGIKLEFEKYADKIVSGYSITAEELDVNDLENHEANTTYDINASLKGVNKAYKASLQSTSPRLYESFTGMWMKLIGDMVGINPKEKGGETKLKILYLNNREIFESIFIQTNNEYKKKYEETVKRSIEEHNFTYSITAPDIKSEEGMEKVDAKKYIFEECYMSKNRSQPEKNFEEFLEKNGEKLSWWYKNEDKGRENFGIRYEHEGAVHTFYPDYLVRFADGTLAIFETKAEKDREGMTYTKSKAEALQKWLVEEMGKRGERILGGIVASSDARNISINHNEEYYPYSERPGEWMSLRL